jgi:hypothetical protein
VSGPFHADSMDRTDWRYPAFPVGFLKRIVRLQQLYVFGAIPLDFITMLAPATRVDCGCSTTKAREEPDMIITGVDCHPSFQQITFTLVNSCMRDFIESGTGHWLIPAKSAKSRHFQWHSTVPMTNITSGLGEVR